MDLIFNGAVTVGAAAFRGLTGFGYALIAAIGLTGGLAPQVMVPLILINDLVLTVVILIDRKQGAVDWPVARTLLVAGCAGAFCGGYLVGYIDESTTKLMISGVVFIAALVAMIHEPPRWLSHHWLGIGCGFIVGGLLAAFAVGGPLVAAWLLAGGTRRETTRGTLAVFFGAVDLFSIISRALLGQIGEGLPHLVMIYLPITLAGYAIGHRIGPKLGPTAWRRVSAGGLLLIAIAGAIQTFRTLVQF